MVITGWRGSGKTSLCSLIVEAAHRAGWSVSGVLSPAVFKEGQKGAILIEDLCTGERRQMARWPETRSPGKVCLDENPFDPGWKPHWVIDKEVMDWGEGVLSRIRWCDLLVVDELGPFELVRAEGWISGLRLVDEKNYRLVLVVVRPELRRVALQRWPHAEFVELESTTQVTSKATYLAQTHLHRLK